jgi:transcriptional pleiotropic regulator of transition state genes
LTKASRGFVRQVDSLGRLVLPVEWRRTMAIEPGSTLELVPGLDGVLTVQPYVPSGACIFCGAFDGTTHFKGRAVCQRCAESIGRPERFRSQEIGGVLSPGGNELAVDRA